jgi:hypothetical protein
VVFLTKVNEHFWRSKELIKSGAGKWSSAPAIGGTKESIRSVTVVMKNTAKGTITEDDQVVRAIPSYDMNLNSNPEKPGVVIF